MGRPCPELMTIGLPRLASDWRRAKRLRIACSVRPGSRAAILCHLLPSSLTERTMVSSSLRDQLTRSGSSSSSFEPSADAPDEAGLGACEGGGAGGGVGGVGGGGAEGGTCVDSPGGSDVGSGAVGCHEPLEPDPQNVARPFGSHGSPLQET